MESYQIVRKFETAIADYAGSRFAIAVDSCTNALFLSCKYLNVDVVTIPCQTYCSVPCAVINSGGRVEFEKSEWEGLYQLKPYPIYDAAGLFERGMYIQNSFFCISFSANKPINIGKGGMILTDDEAAAAWFRKARYCGRREMPLVEDDLDMVGWNMYMQPEQAARGHLLMQFVDSKYQMGISYKRYPDLSKFKVYKDI